LPFMSKRTLMSPRTAQDDVAICLSARMSSTANLDVLLGLHQILKCEGFHSKEGKVQRNQNFRRKQSWDSSMYTVAWMPSQAPKGGASRPASHMYVSITSRLPLAF
jgi:hypothetical protein